MPGSKFLSLLCRLRSANRLLDSLLPREAKRRYPLTEPDITCYVVCERGVGGAVSREP
jgi:hypothetical protein